MPLLYRYSVEEFRVRLTSGELRPMDFDTHPARVVDFKSRQTLELSDVAGFGLNVEVTKSGDAWYSGWAASWLRERRGELNGAKMTEGCVVAWWCGSGAWYLELDPQRPCVYGRRYYIAGVSFTPVLTEGIITTFSAHSTDNVRIVSCGEQLYWESAHPAHPVVMDPTTGAWRRVRPTPIDRSKPDLFRANSKQYYLHPNGSIKRCSRETLVMVEEPQPLDATTWVAKMGSMEGGWYLAEWPDGYTNQDSTRAMRFVGNEVVFHDIKKCWDMESNGIVSGFGRDCQGLWYRLAPSLANPTLKTDRSQTTWLTGMMNDVRVCGRATHDDKLDATRFAAHAKHSGIGILHEDLKIMSFVIGFHVYVQNVHDRSYLVASDHDVSIFDADTEAEAVAKAMAPTCDVKDALTGSNCTVPEGITYDHVVLWRGTIFVQNDMLTPAFEELPTGIPSLGGLVRVPRAVSRHITPCCLCGVRTAHPRSGGRNYHVVLDDVQHDGQVCEECHAARQLRACDDCGTLFTRHVLLDSPVSGTCPECIEDHYTECSRCGSLIHESNVGRNGECNSCRNNNRLRPFDFTPRLKFHRLHNEQITFGCEIELEHNEYEDESDVAASASSVLAYPACENFLYAKRDGSLNHGAEFVTQPFTWAWYKKNKGRIKEMFDKFGNEGFEARGTCGLHIHVGREIHSALEELRLFNLVYGNPDSWVKASKRKTNMSYCRITGEEVRMSERMRVARDRAFFRERYVAINPNHHNTLEWRLWAGTDSFTEFDTALRLTVGAHEFIRTASNLKPTMGQFKSFITNHHEFGAAATRLAI